METIEVNDLWLAIPTLVRQGVIVTYLLVGVVVLFHIVRDIHKDDLPDCLMTGMFCGTMVGPVFIVLFWPTVIMYKKSKGWWEKL